MSLQNNINPVDRIIRVIIAAIVTLLYFTNIISGTPGIVLMVGAGIILVTSVINFCPIYYVFGISTAGREAK